MFNHQTFSGLSIAEFHALHPEKPVMIAEIGAAEKSEDDQAKAEWITHTYGIAVKEYPYIKALLWFSVLKEDEEIDWRVNSSEVSLNAFRIAISGPYYLDQVFITGNNSKPCKIFLPLIKQVLAEVDDPFMDPCDIIRSILHDKFDLSGQ
jgi:hypothetical protein